MSEDYKNSLDRVYESQIAGHRCGRCGRVISDDDRYSCKRSIVSPDLFAQKYGIRPKKSVAFVCGHCNYEIETEGKISETEVELFTQFTPEFNTTVRKQLEDQDLLSLLSTIQQKIMGVTNEFCVRDIFTTGGYACPIEVSKLTCKDCNNCLRKWLRSTHPKFVVR